MPRPITITFKEPENKKDIHFAMHSSLPEGMGYLLMPQTSTYALGVDALRASYLRGECPEQPIVLLPNGSSSVRPLTFRENLTARIEDYETLRDAQGNERTPEDRLRFFGRWLYSCTGAGYKAKTTKFKIISESQALITIPAEFQQHYLPISYDTLEGVELDSSEEGVLYNALLSKNQVGEHPAWLAAVEEDRYILEKYADIFFALLKETYQREAGMAFWIRQNTDADELRALFVNGLNYISNAYGNYNLISNGSFLQVAQPLPRSGAL